jgi:hypothetical protein
MCRRGLGCGARCMLQRPSLASWASQHRAAAQTHHSRLKVLGEAGSGPVTCTSATSHWQLQPTSLLFAGGSQPHSPATSTSWHTSGREDSGIWRVPRLSRIVTRRILNLTEAGSHRTTGNAGHHALGLLQRRLGSSYTLTGKPRRPHGRPVEPTRRAVTRTGRRQRPAAWGWNGPGAGGVPDSVTPPAQARTQARTCVLCGPRALQSYLLHQPITLRQLPDSTT